MIARLLSAHSLFVTARSLPTFGNILALPEVSLPHPIIFVSISEASSSVTMTTAIPCLAGVDASPCVHSSALIGLYPLQLYGLKVL